MAFQEEKGQVCNLIEKENEMNKELIVTYIDLKTSFDTVQRSVLLEIMEAME